MANFTDLVNKYKNQLQAGISNVVSAAVPAVPIAKGAVALKQKIGQMMDSPTPIKQQVTNRIKTELYKPRDFGAAGKFMSLTAKPLERYAEKGMDVLGKVFDVPSAALLGAQEETSRGLPIKNALARNIAGTVAAPLKAGIGATKGIVKRFAGDQDYYVGKKIEESLKRNGIPAGPALIAGLAAEIAIPGPGEVNFVGKASKAGASDLASRVARETGASEKVTKKALREIELELLAEQKRIRSLPFEQLKKEAVINPMPEWLQGNRQATKDLNNLLTGKVSEKTLGLDSNSIDRLVAKSNAGKTTKVEEKQLGNLFKNQEVMGATAGMELYKDENGKWKTRYNPIKGALGVGIMGGVKAIKEDNLAQRMSTGNFSVDDYVKSMKKLQDVARKSSSPGIQEKARAFMLDFATKMEDRFTPIEDVAERFKKNFNAEVRPQFDPSSRIDEALRSDSIADQFATDNGLVKMIQSLSDKDMDAFNQYLIAKHSLELSKIRPDVATGRDLVKDAKLVESLAPKFSQQEMAFRSYVQKLQDFMVNGDLSTRQGGIISQDLMNTLREQYPEYVPFNRIFGDDEAVKGFGGGRGVASIGQQKTVQRIKGSERQIENPLLSILEQTRRAFREVKANQAADATIRLAEQLGEARKLPIGEAIGNRNTISRIVNGEKQVYEVSKEISEAAKGLNAENLGLVGELFRINTRILQAGATGFNLPFAITNLFKDQITAFINSDNVAKTSILNPVNFTKSLFATVGGGDLADAALRRGAISTSFDIGKKAGGLDKLRAEKNVLTKASYVVKNPAELLGVLENMVGSTEKLTRYQQFGGMVDEFLSKGASRETAEILAAKAARSNTANFARAGSWGKVINGVIPFFNAGIQGAASFRRAFAKDPTGVSAKVVSTILLPTAMAHSWNMRDPERRRVYEDISDYEKENNLILIPPTGATKDEKGRYKVIKLPIPPGLSNLATIQRKIMDRAYSLDAKSATDIFSNILASTTGVDFSNPASALTPQLAKPMVEATMNKNLFTGQEIVPSEMRFLPKEEQANPWTSGTARIIGKKLNMSPLMVENLSGTIAAGVGKQLLNVSDKILSKFGLVSTVGGEDPFDNLARRFSRASGGEVARKQEVELTKGMDRTQTAIYDFMKSYKSRADKIDMTPGEREWLKIGENALKLADPTVRKALEEQARTKAIYNNEPINPLLRLSDEQRKIVLTLNALPPGSSEKKTLQKQNINWLKPYWEANSNYFAYKSASSFSNVPTAESASDLVAPKPSARAQALMDAGNFKDTEVKAYLDANNAYKNALRGSMGLPSTDSGFKKFQRKARLRKPRTIKLAKIKQRRTRVPRPKKIKARKMSLRSTRKIRARKIPA